MGERLAKKVLLIGWDAADWKFITPLMDGGFMPTLNQMVNEGVMGNAATLIPMLSPMVWTSIATGKRADKHGIHGFTEPIPEDDGIRPVTSTSRTCKAVWNILTQKGFKTHVVGWFASHPSEPINGVCVSNMYSHSTAPPGKPWPMRKGTVQPARLAKTLAGLRIHPGELIDRDLLPFIPDAAKIDQEKDKRLVVLAKNISECATIHAAATWIMENEPWDFMAVYYIAIDHFSHAFMRYHPPKMENVKDEDFAMYKDVVTGAYRFHDMMLERLLQLAGEDTTVLLISDHGFHSDHLRPKGIPKEPAGPAVQHRSYGVFTMKGPRILKDERIYGVSVLDVTPTVLTLFGLPLGEDMDGKPLLHAFDHEIKVEKIPSWDTVEGECGMHPPDMQQDPFEARERLEQLAALGYIDKPDENKKKAVETSRRESSYNLARVFLNSNRPKRAAELLEPLVKDNPEEDRFAQHLAQAYYRMRKFSDARRLIEDILKRRNKSPRADLLMGILLFNEGKTDEALEHLLKAEEAEPRLPTLHCQIGNVYLRKKRWADAERAFRTAIEIDGDSANAHHGLSVSLLGLKQNMEAAEEALRAVGLLHHLPQAHYHLGIALGRLGMITRAIHAFETSLSMRPKSIRTHSALARFYGRGTDDEIKAKYHAMKARELGREAKKRKNE